MNIKVVIVWIFVIILLFCLGILGYMNQDLLIIPDDTYIPIVDDVKTITCSSQTDEYESIYRFSVKDDTIERISIMYKTNVEDFAAYTSASVINKTISDEALTGLSAVLDGEVSNFSLTVGVNPRNYAKTRVEEMNDYYSHLFIVIDSITDVENYKKTLSYTGNLYTCE